MKCDKSKMSTYDVDVLHGCQYLVSIIQGCPSAPHRTNFGNCILYLLGRAIQADFRDGCLPCDPPQQSTHLGTRDVSEMPVMPPLVELKSGVPPGGRASLWS